jgi:pilus assembly protein Flp/PilA
MIKRFLSNRDGATAIEYAMLAAMLSVALITALGSIGGSVDTMISGTHR